MIDALMRLALARLELLSYGKTASPAASPTCEHPGGGPPQGSLRLQETPPHHWLRTAYENCDTDPQRLLVILKAQGVLIELTTRKHVVIHEETAAQWLARVLSAEGWPARDVAVSLRCSASEVRRLRSENGRDPETGLAAVLDAQTLRASGASWREIARLIDQPQATVRYRLRSRA